MFWVAQSAKVKNECYFGFSAVIKFEYCYSGIPKIPRSWCFRLIVLSYLIMGMLLSCGFSSTLTSYLTTKGNSLPLANLEDVARKKTHSLCVRNDSSAYRHFTIVCIGNSRKKNTYICVKETKVI